MRNCMIFYEKNTLEGYYCFKKMAKSGAWRTEIPGHAAHSFRSMAHSDSGASRTL